MMPSRGPSIQAIADAVGVSRATVSRALHDSPLVKPLVREKIKIVAKKLGYRPDAKLKELMVHLRKGRTRTVSETLAVVMSMSRERYLKTSTSVLGPLLQGMKKQALALGFGLDTFHLEEYGYHPERLTKVLWSRGIRGVVFYAMQPDDSELSLDLSRFSAVTSGYSLLKPAIHRVCHYHIHGVRMACQNLRALGYHRIGLSMDTVNDTNTDHGYLAGYSDEQSRHAAPPIEPFLYRNFQKPAFAKWLRANRPDAIIVPGQIKDYLELLHSLRYDVPRRIGLASLHIREESVTGVDQRSAVIGENTVNLVAGMIFRNETGIPDKPITIQVEGVWNPGSTCRPVLG